MKQTRPIERRNRAPTGYFPTEDPDFFIAFDYNPDTGLYDLNYRIVHRDKVPISSWPKSRSGPPRRETKKAGSKRAALEKAPSKTAAPKKAAPKKAAPKKAAPKKAAPKKAAPKKAPAPKKRRPIKKKRRPIKRKRRPVKKHGNWKGYARRGLHVGHGRSPDAGGGGGGYGREGGHGGGYAAPKRAARKKAAPKKAASKKAAPKRAKRWADSLVPATERQINIWIGEKDTGLKRMLKIGHADILSFRIGQPMAESLISGDAAAVSDVPVGGLPTNWLVVARGAELAVGTPDTEVSVAPVDGVSTWSGRFKILIPEEGDSTTPQLKIKPLQVDPTIDVVVTTRDEVYRQFKIVLAVVEGPGVAPAAPVRIVDELMPTATAHIGLSTTHEWTTPNGSLSVIVFGSQAAVQGVAGLEQVDSLEPWVGVPSQVSGRIKNVRDAAEEIRAAWENHLNDIDPIDLANRLKRWNRGGGGPEYDWGSLGNHADCTHRHEWEKMAVSAELRQLAKHGRQLFQAFFPRNSNFWTWLGALPPGARLSISWTPKAGAGFIPHVPWGLMYTADVPDGGPVDPMGFLGLRCRIAYNSHVAVPASRSLGALDATHRAHFLYWGNSPNDVTGQEARWQRSRWDAWPNQVFVPETAQNAKAELLKLLNDPQPSPTSLIYLFCQCNTGAGNNPTLRFGSTNDPANVVVQTDFGTSALADRPLVFANACTTTAADPYMANDLEERFFERDCRAYIGTETKVPIVFGSRFAEIFFQFFYRLLDSAPMAAGEAVTQARIFLWTHYRNIGGLFYSCMNQYDLFLAREDEVRALRG
jgi:outer membrane biosynthesis protein TonB